MTQTQTSAAPRYEFLDSLRGFAILGVVSTHCAYFSGGDFRGKPFADAGLYGVQLFFMVSAFTIFLTLERALSRERAIIRSFYIRRVLRILPMFWVGIVLYAFAPGREHYYTDFHMDFSYYLLTAILQHGWHPYYINSVVPGGWTIAVEATFYIIAPFIFFRIKNWQSALYFFLITLFVCEAAGYCLRMAIDHQLLFQQVQQAQPELLRQFAHKWFPSQLPVFACGILTFYILKALPETFHSQRNGLLLLSTSLMVLYNAVGISGHRLIPEQVFFALGFLLFILALAIYPLPLLVNSATGFLGRISYSFYLMHFLLMVGIIHVFQSSFPADFSKPWLAYILLFIATLVVSIPVSWVTYKTIEQPFIRLGASLIRRLNANLERKAGNSSIIT
jgi:peptidoglycan/LPS O-acetylase OafA/YrhL